MGREINESKEFWGDYTETSSRKHHIHICNVPEEVFYARHKHTLSLIKDKGYNPSNIGILIAGKHYNHIWAAKTCDCCPDYLSHLVKSQRSFYRMGSLFYNFLIDCLLDNQMLIDFKEADLKDQQYSILN